MFKIADPHDDGNHRRDRSFAAGSVNLLGRRHVAVVNVASNFHESSRQEPLFLKRDLRLLAMCHEPPLNLT